MVDGEGVFGEVQHSVGVTEVVWMRYVLIVSIVDTVCTDDCLYMISRANLLSVCS